VRDALSDSTTGSLRLAAPALTAAASAFGAAQQIVRRHLHPAGGLDSRSASRGR
jgi:hypothetical protein